MPFIPLSHRISVNWDQKQKNSYPEYQNHISLIKNRDLNIVKFPRDVSFIQQCTVNCQHYVTL